MIMLLSYNPLKWGVWHMDMVGYRYGWIWDIDTCIHDHHVCIRSISIKIVDHDFGKTMIDMYRSCISSKNGITVYHRYMYMYCTWAGPLIRYMYMIVCRSCPSIHVTVLVENGTPFLAKIGQMMMADTCHGHVSYIPWAL